MQAILHARTNTYANLVAATRGLAATATFPTGGPGLKWAIAWIDRRSEPGSTLVAVDGANSYRSGLTYEPRAMELDICHMRPPSRVTHASHRKLDNIDAQLAARAVPDQQVEALWNLFNAWSTVDRRVTAELLTFTSMLRTMGLAIDARQTLIDEQVLLVGRRRAHHDHDLQARIARAEAKRLATAILKFHALLAANHTQLQEVLGLMAPGLLDLFDFGSVSAA